MISLLSSLLVLTPLALGAQYTVVVGGEGILKFTPEYVNAVAGDTIRFDFRVKNHTATQSSLETPCQALTGGFDSGFQPVLATQTTDFPYKDYTVADANPAWFYCQQGTHCSAAAMVFAVNPGYNFDAFKANAVGGATPTASATGTATGGYPTPTGSATTAVAAPSPSAGSGPQDHVIVVGGPGLLAYTPSNITANVGDTITFQFKVKNHTVTQSSFENPCRKLEFTSSSGQIGFDSGFKPVADSDVTFPEFKITVNDTKPVWAYCRQTAGNHCGNGMVFSVNAVESGANNFAAFQANAKRLNGTATQPAPGGAASLLTPGVIGLLGAVLAPIALML